MAKARRVVTRAWQNVGCMTLILGVMLLLFVGFCTGPVEAQTGGMPVFRTIHFQDGRFSRAVNVIYDHRFGVACYEDSSGRNYGCVKVSP
jgi:hypothetical protein